MEIWKNVKGYEGAYQVSNLGRVKSLDREVLRVDGIKVNFKGRVLKVHPNKHGYLIVGLLKNSNRKTFKIHRLVATAFIDNKENKPQVNHVNGKKLDNNINNLEWVTGSENVKHAFKTGLQSSKKGINNGRSKLTEAEVIEIRKLYSKGNVTRKQLKDRFKVSSGCIHHVIKKTSWAWL